MPQHPQTIQLYNTLTRQVEPLKPIKPGEVSLYTCGPTVYNYAHVGNLRAFVFYDTLRRTLEATGLTVHHTMNITDVGHLVDDEDESSLSEDKLEKGARREGKSVWDVAANYTEAFEQDMQLMNILPPTENPHRSKNSADDPYARATDFIPEQIDMVKTLLDKGFAYQTQQAIYFDISKLPSYGELSGQKLADKEVAVRTDVVTDPDKRHPYDFSVWFFTVGRYADHTMHWPSPWGDGFPGWHLECSAIIHATLDDHTATSTGHPIDIHTGGVDHIGTHHPNEMAQTEAAFGHKLANLWMHNEFTLVDGAKMSKSKGNTYTLKEVMDRGYHPLALRLLYLQAHYRSEVNFTWESLEAAQNRLLNLYAWADLYHQQQLLGDRYDEVHPSKHWERYVDYLAVLKSQINNDLGAPIKDSLIKTTFLSQIQIVIEATDAGFIPQHKLNPIVRLADQILGLNLANRPDITPAQKQIIADREAARTTKDWAKADELRAKLATHNLAVDDTPAGPRWRRTVVQ